MENEVKKKFSLNDNWVLLLITTMVYMMVTNFVFEEIFSKQYDLIILFGVEILWIIYSVFQVKKIIKYVINLINKYK